MIKMSRCTIWWMNLSSIGLFEKINPMEDDDIAVVFSSPPAGQGGQTAS